MASEEAANAGAQPAAPAAPMKSRKKRQEKPEAREGAQEGARRRAVGRGHEVEGLVRAGRRALAAGDAQEAVGRFRKALLLSAGAASPRLRRACAFNLGAAYVESGEPEKGLEFLLRSQPAEGQSGARPRDLYFSIGAAREGLRDFPKALERFGEAIGPDRAAQASSRAGTRVRMGCCYLGMREPARAARCFLDAARTYEEAASPEAAAVALSRASGCMLQSQRFTAAEIAGVLAQCRSLCEGIPDPALRGNAAPRPCPAAPWGAAPAPSFSARPRRKTLQRHRPRLLPAPRLLPGCRELRAGPRPVRRPAGPAQGGCAAAEPGRCPQRPARLRQGPALAPASGSAARWVAAESLALSALLDVPARAEAPRSQFQALWGTGGRRGSASGTWRTPAASSEITRLLQRTTCTPCKPSATWVRAGAGKLHLHWGAAESLPGTSSATFGPSTDTVCCFPGDVQGQWQACEGLGAACFHLGDPQKAVGHYKEALTLLSHCQVRRAAETPEARPSRASWGACSSPGGSPSRLSSGWPTRALSSPGHPQSGPRAGGAQADCRHPAPALPPRRGLPACPSPGEHHPGGMGQFRGAGGWQREARWAEGHARVNPGPPLHPSRTPASCSFAPRCSMPAGCGSGGARRE